MSAELEGILRPVKTRATKFLDDSAKAVREAGDFFRSLSRKAEKEMGTKRDAASYRAARIIGHGAGRALELVRQIETPPEVSWESLKILKDDLSTSVRSLRDIRARTGAELSGFYILDMRSFSGIVERLAKNAERLTAFLDGDGSNLQKARTINGIIESMKTARDEAQDKQKEAALLQGEQTAREASIKKLIIQTEELASNPLLNEVLAIEKEIRKESRTFRTETLAHLQRPMRRLREISERGDFPIDTEQREALSKYLLAPYKSFLSPASAKYLKPILENMRNAIESGKMEFKPRKTSRISNHIRELITTTQLSEKQRHGIRLLARRRELLQSPECKNMHIQRKEMIARIESEKRELETLETKLLSAHETVKLSDQRLSELALLAENKTREYVRREIQLEHSTSPVLTHQKATGT